MPILLCPALPTRFAQGLMLMFYSPSLTMKAQGLIKLLSAVMASPAKVEDEAIKEK